MYAFNQMGFCASDHRGVPDEYGQKPKAPSHSLAGQASQLQKGSPAFWNYRWFFFLAEIKTDTVSVDKHVRNGQEVSQSLQPASQVC